MWGVRHAHVRFARGFGAEAAEQRESTELAVRGGRRHHIPNYGTVLLRHQEPGLQDEGRGRQSVDEQARDGLDSPCAKQNVLSDQSRKYVRGAYEYYFWDEKGG